MAQERCGVRWESLCCTRPKGHDGNHRDDVYEFNGNQMIESDRKKEKLSLARQLCEVRFSQQKAARLEAERALKEYNNAVQDLLKVTEEK